MPKSAGIGLKAIEGKTLIGYKDLSEATGLKVRTLKTYHNRNRNGKPRLIPKSDWPGVWRADRQDIREWIQGIGRPGPGARTDLKKDDQ